MISLTRLFAASILVFAPAVVSAGNVNFTDGTFNDNDWAFSVGSIDPTMSAGVQQALTGGNPGARRETTMNLGPLPYNQTANMILRNINTTFLYDPAVSGAISEISFSFDVKATQPYLGQGFASVPLFEQNGLFYAPLPALQNLTYSTDSWVIRAFTGALNAWDLTPGVGLPDFSATGAPIRFGYAVATSYYCPNPNGCTGITVADSLDNFHVTVTSVPNQDQVPEPSTFVLGATAVAALTATRLRKS